MTEYAIALEARLAEAEARIARQDRLLEEALGIARMVRELLEPRRFVPAPRRPQTCHATMDHSGDALPYGTWTAQLQAP